MNPNTQNPDQPESLISMPDHLRTPEMTAAPEASVVSERGVVSTPADEFKGDPTRVMGHPSNPDSGIVQAAASAVENATEARLAEQQSQLERPLVPGAIAEVPDFNK